MIDIDKVAMELLPCPFCGGTELHRVADNINHTDRVKCNGCNANAVLWKWNTRDQSALQFTRDQALEEIYQKIDARRDKHREKYGDDDIVVGMGYCLDMMIALKSSSVPRTLAADTSALLDAKDSTAARQEATPREEN